MSTPRRTPYTTDDLHFWWSAEHTPPALEVNCASPNKREEYLLRIRSGYSTARLWAEQPADALALAGELERCARELRAAAADPLEISHPEERAGHADGLASMADPMNDPSTEVQP